MVVSFVTILLFCIYTWGLGFTATYYLNKPDNSLERFFLNIGIGLGIFPILSILLNFLHVPLDWKIFLLISIVFPLFILCKRLAAKQINFSEIKPKLTKSSLVMLAVLLIFAVSLFIYAKGAFTYPYMEDEDPWGHAVGAKYVALEKNAYDPPIIKEGRAIDPVLSYIDPYPPAYDILMGILHQTSLDLTWTLKFFNALIISLGFIFFYLFVKVFIGDRNKALLSTFILAAIPSYLSHFIWAHSLVIVLFFPTMYAFEQARENKRWMFIALLLVASIWVTQNLEQPIKLSTMILIYLIVISITCRKLYTIGFVSLVGGVLVSMLWWGMMISKYTLKGFIGYFVGDVASSSDIALASSGGGVSSIAGKFLAILSKLTYPGGTGARAYTFDDLFFAKGQNMINNPIGIGIVISLLVLIGVGFLLWKHRSQLVENKNTWICVALFWLIFTYWGIMGRTFPASVTKAPFRVWMLLAIPLALISTEAIYSLKSLFSKSTIKLLIITVAVVGIILTSGYQKYEINTAIWPASGSFVNPSEPFEYGAWFKTIPLNSNVFLYSPRDKLTIGLGGFSCDWCQEIYDFRRVILYKNASELYSFLRNNDYDYLLINGMMDSKYFNSPSQFGVNKTQSLLPKRYDEIMNFPLFVPIYHIENRFIVFKVN